MSPLLQRAAACLAVLTLAAVPALAAENDKQPPSSVQEPASTISQVAANDETTEIVVQLEVKQPVPGTVQQAQANSPDSYSWNDQQERLRLRQIAEGYLGTPYRWGGTTPAAFDCSGFTRFCYAKMGIRLPRTAREQYRVGSPVRNGTWETGDLIFFDMSKGYVSHVGMYLGSYAFIHASNPTSGVRIDSLRKRSYRSHYVGARRYDVT